MQQRESDAQFVSKRFELVMSMYDPPLEYIDGSDLPIRRVRFYHEDTGWAELAVFEERLHGQPPSSESVMSVAVEGRKDLGTEPSKTVVYPDLNILFSPDDSISENSTEAHAVYVSYVLDRAIDANIASSDEIAFLSRGLQVCLNNITHNFNFECDVAVENGVMLCWQDPETYEDIELRITEYVSRGGGNPIVFSEIDVTDSEGGSFYRLDHDQGNLYYFPDIECEGDYLNATYRSEHIKRFTGLISFILTNTDI